MTQLDESYVAELEELGLVWVSPAGHYDEDAATICQLAARLAGFGFEGRHMPQFSCGRGSSRGLLSRWRHPGRTTGREGDSKVRSQEAIGEIAALFVQLHASLLRAELTRSGKA